MVCLDEAASGHEASARRGERYVFPGHTRKARGPLFHAVTVSSAGPIENASADHSLQVGEVEKVWSVTCRQAHPLQACAPRAAR